MIEIDLLNIHVCILHSYHQRDGVESMMAESVHGIHYRHELETNGNNVEDLANPNENKQKAENFFFFSFF